MMIIYNNYIRTVIDTMSTCFNKTQTRSSSNVPSVSRA